MAGDRNRTAVVVMLVVGLAWVVGADIIGAQGRGGGAPVSARAAAPEDLTGTWMSVVTEHWHLRMLVPPKGDYSMLPLNAEARKIASAWDPSKEPPEEACKAYGAAAILRVPGRIHLQWVDDNTLQLDTDSGSQTRLLRFGNAGPPAEPPGWQGYSVASWVGAGGRGRAIDGTGQLKVVTTKMRPGYLRRNGVPYGPNATLEEYFDRFGEPNGDTWMVVTSIVTDPQYLTQPYATTYAFKKIPDREGWDPTPCRVTEAR